MKRLILVGAVCLGAAMLSGCTVDDPLGATTRAKDHNSAWVTTNRADNDTRISQAQADENARIAIAQADSTARITASNNDLSARTKEAETKLAITQEQEREQTQRASIWGTMIATTVFICGLALIILLVVNWGGKIAFMRAKYALSTQQLMLLQDYADRTGKKIVMQNGQYYLTDGQTTIRAILKT